MRSILLAATAAAMLAPAADAQTTVAAIDKRVIGAATLENIPPIPADLAAALARYQESRAASFADWANDGSMLVLTRFAATAQLHRVKGPGMARTQITFASEPIAAARAIPGSDSILFARDTGGDEWTQIYVLGPDLKPVQLTETGTQNGQIVVARDGGAIYWSRATKGSGDRTIWRANPAEPASARQIFQGTGVIAPSDISADGKTLLLTRSISAVAQQLYLLDIATGTVTEIAKGPTASLDGARFARGGRAVLAISNRDSDVERLVEIDIASGKLTPISAASSWSVEEFDLSEDGRILAYAINEDGYSRVIVQDYVTRRAMPQPALPRGVVSTLALSRDGGKLAIGLAASNAPGDVWSWEVRAGKLDRWTESEIGPIDRTMLPEPRLVRFPSFDTLSVPAFVYRTKTVPTNARTPVVIVIHGGPEGQARPGWTPQHAAMADQLGATIIVPNVRGSTGYGTRYLNLDNAEKREDSVKDIGALIDWIKTRPDLDGSKIAVIGGSYGGYMSLAVMTRYSAKLAGGVDLFGIGDWMTFLKNTEAYRRDARRAEYGDERDPAMAAVFARISPRANVAGITKPMLIEQGANDPRVPRSESEQMVAAIRANGVPVSYLLFADEGHGWRKKVNQVLSQQAEIAFLKRLFEAAK
ncbi:MAG: alpha/beta fold hydrolase [Sphingomonas sp.]|uniref:S9 family peptidase n=1 Tax=Sphingomonas sp. TaxID=28214 RepID=UPI0025FE6C43|nr:alpha/beta fold hydrolase [Sphingomonas sp.]MBY0282473.1 alpha/beta fold hydrolase [Sphingomonas sp.]